MFIEQKDGLVYVSNKTGKLYDLLLGVTSNDYSSDMLFIMDRNEIVNKDGYHVESKLVNFIYGGFDNRDFIEDEIMLYEKDMEEKED